MQEKVNMSLLKTSETECIQMTMLGCEEVCFQSAFDFDFICDSAYGVGESVTGLIA